MTKKKSKRIRRFLLGPSSKVEIDAVPQGLDVYVFVPKSLIVNAEHFPPDGTPFRVVIEWEEE